MKPGQVLRVLTFRLDRVTWDRLLAFCALRGLVRNHVLQTAVREYLDRQGEHS